MSSWFSQTPTDASASVCDDQDAREKEPLNIVEGEESESSSDTDSTGDDNMSKKWVLSVNDNPAKILKEGDIEAVVMLEAMKLREQLVLTGNYKNIYLEPVDEQNVYIVGSNSFFVVAYERILGVVSCVQVPDDTE